jgi:hypothetical protein
LATPGMTGSTVGEAAQGGLKHMCMHWFINTWW